MISQKYRFHGHSSLRYVMSNGQILHSKFFAVRWATNERRHRPRVSVVVSKKVFKSAVKRNRIRRRIYEIVRHLLPGSPAVDVVISVYSSETLTATHDELTIQLLPLLHKAGLGTHQTHK